MQLEELNKERLEKLARYLAHGISAENSGGAVGYSETKVLMLLETSEFQEILQKEREDIIANYVDTNTMYDRLEKKALGNIENSLKYNTDPDFNFKVAMLANRAIRRGSDGLQDNKPLDAAAANGGRITLNLSQQFVLAVQAGPLQKTVDVEVHRNELDVATPDEVSNLLQIKSYRNTELSGPTPQAEIRSLADFLDPV